MARPEAVIFDIGNVLIEWQPERFFDAAIGPAERKRMFYAVDLHGMNDAIDLGAPFRDTVYQFAALYPEWEAQIRLWHDNWLDMAAPVIPHSVRLMAALQARKVPVFALTNFGEETYQMAAPTYPFLRRFDRAYVSGNLKITKPDQAIYAHVEADSGLAPDALLFTDDRVENIETAAARGWQVHHFTGPAGFAARLVDEGLLTEEEAA
ncbi:MAG: HAD family phosphatase [Albidovulum sp.]